ncbi:MAG TPA: 30S ribosomal protein S17 [Armatimonadota bacterium]|jgi:small subunit ribosomal protein S17
MSDLRSVRRAQQGLVISDKMDKTVVVQIERLTRHRLYDKVTRKAVHFKAHDEKNECRVGDVVKIVECRPLSRQKSWRVTEILAHEK